MLFMIHILHTITIVPYRLSVRHHDHHMHPIRKHPFFVSSHGLVTCTSPRYRSCVDVGKCRAAVSVFKTFIILLFRSSSERGSQILVLKTMNTRLVVGAYALGSESEDCEAIFRVATDLKRRQGRFPISEKATIPTTGFYASYHDTRCFPLVEIDPNKRCCSSYPFEFPREGERVVGRQGAVTTSPRFPGIGGMEITI
ncbi:hypothetical protein BS17DRAFT_559849 [Gyrodon lividus]|nr:hypothetical protein BS17DRAFT_559849 [Gyrodon lividus]